MPATAMLIVLAGCDGRNGEAQPEPGEDAAGDVAVSGERAPSTTTSEPTARAPTGDATPTAVESASTSASPPHSTTPPTTPPTTPSPAPSPAPSSEPTLYTLPNVPADDVARNRAALTAIPASYLGEWDGVEGSCAPGSDLRMMVRPGSIGFYESRGEGTAMGWWCRWRWKAKVSAGTKTTRCGSSAGGSGWPSPRQATPIASRCANAARRIAAPAHPDRSPP